MLRIKHSKEKRKADEEIQEILNPMRKKPKKVRKTKDKKTRR